MNNGRVLVAALVLCAFLLGILLYYFQIHAFYRTFSHAQADVMLTIRSDDRSEMIRVRDFTGIDANSSPIRFRACFTVDDPVDTKRQPVKYAVAAPLQAPGWFDCFDAAAITKKLAAQQASAWLGTQNLYPGVDRVVALESAGTASDPATGLRGWAWNQLNPWCTDAYMERGQFPEQCRPKGGTRIFEGVTHKPIY